MNEPEKYDPIKHGKWLDATRAVLELKRLNIRATTDSAHGILVESGIPYARKVLKKGGNRYYYFPGFGEREKKNIYAHPVAIKNRFGEMPYVEEFHGKWPLFYQILKEFQSRNLKATSERVFKLLADRNHPIAVEPTIIKTRSYRVRPFREADWEFFESALAAGKMYSVDKIRRALKGRISNLPGRDRLFKILLKSSVPRADYLYGNRNTKRFEMPSDKQVKEIEKLIEARRNE